MKEANRTKWYGKILAVLLVVVFFPITILLLLIAAPFLIRGFRTVKKEYYKSPYYADFKKKYTLGITSDPAYRFYNGAKARDLPVRYVSKNDGQLYFVYGDTLFRKFLCNFRSNVNCSLTNVTVTKVIVHCLLELLHS